MSDAEKTPFERQRDALIQEIVVSFDQVLTNLNHLNRSLEGVSAVGREFESVEALWAKFDAVMSKNVSTTTGEAGADAEGTNGGENVDGAAGQTT